MAGPRYGNQLSQWLDDPNQTTVHEMIEEPEQPANYASVRQYQYADIDSTYDIDQKMCDLSFASITSPARPFNTYNITSWSSSNLKTPSSVPSEALTSTSISLGGGAQAPGTWPSLRALDGYNDVDGQGTISCILKKYLDVPCDDSDCRTRNGFYTHVLSHFGGHGAPAEALCIFCDFKFQSSRPQKYLDEYLQHVFDHMFIGSSIENMMADFLAVAYLRDKGIISVATYLDVCKEFDQGPVTSGCPSSSKRADKEASESRQQVEVNSPVRKKKEDSRKNRDGYGRSSGLSKHKKKKK